MGFKDEAPLTGNPEPYGEISVMCSEVSECPGFEARFRRQILGAERVSRS